MDALPVSWPTEAGIVWLSALTGAWVAWVWHASGHPARRALGLGLLVLAWSLYAHAAVRWGFDRAWFGPLRPLVYLLLAAGATWLWREALLGRGLDQRLLIGLQLIRPIGMVFVLEHHRGLLPAWFAYPAGYGDLAVGLLAAWVLWRHRHGPIPDGAVRLVFFAGMADFASAFFFGFATAPTPLQLIATDPPNQVLLYPTGLIPLFLVPYAVAFHLLSWAQMRRGPLPRIPA